MRVDFLPGISVELRSNGQALKEYEDEDTIDGEHATATRYVEVVPNSEFFAHLVFQDHFAYRLDDLVLGIRIDGHEAESVCISPNLYLPEQHAKLSHRIKNIGGVGRKEAFAFGELKTSTFLGYQSVDFRTNVCSGRVD